MSAAGYWRDELLDDRFLDEADARAYPHGPGAGLLAIALLLGEVAHTAGNRRAYQLEAQLRSASDSLRYAVDVMSEGRGPRRLDAVTFLDDAIVAVPELAELEAIGRGRKWIEAQP